MFAAITPYYARRDIERAATPMRQLHAPATYAAAADAACRYLMLRCHAPLRYATPLFRAIISPLRQPR